MLHAALHSAAARPLRFAITGGSAGLLQLALLAFLVRHGWHAIPANLGAFLVAAQFNFLLSTVFTWHDRRAVGGLWRRWLAFHGAIAGMALLNMLVFVGVRQILPDLAASAAGIAVAAFGNFVIGDRVVFRRRHNLSRAARRSLEEPAA